MCTLASNASATGLGASSSALLAAVRSQFAGRSTVEEAQLEDWLKGVNVEHQLPRLIRRLRDTTNSGTADSVTKCDL